MDVFPDVIAYGILLLPKGIKEGEKRPVVVCQHGLEDGPAMSPTRRSTIRPITVTPSGWPSRVSSHSHPKTSTSSKIASAPPRKANPLKKTCSP